MSMRNILRAAIVTLFVALVCGQLGSAQDAASIRHSHFKSLEDYAKYINSHHKAPFDRDSVRLPQGAAAEILRQLAQRKPETTAATGHNVKVNRDRDPWPKAEIAVGVDPTNSNVVVMSNDFRENWNHMFYHVSTNGGSAWSDDSMVGGNDANTGFIPLTFESDPGVAFDDKGHSFLSTITGNLIFSNDYVNLDTQVIVAQGYNHGTYTNLLPIVIDTQPCIFSATTSNCPATLDKPLITVDSVPGSPNNGTIYVYYTVFCNAAPCPYGSGSIPRFSSEIVASHSAVTGVPLLVPPVVR